ncbi:hypothetical protein SAMN05428989_2596 [Pseudoxanthomonas sp. GM95]|uniref:hypothetical protein n=1 Tax=Pseudoxanthomonas sp. GM95 TaxID=1881043 RepID=UPI0008D60EAA|nr:hypothetical protein [Pseudoxanthomonas sp. GM95]SEL82069.1 hypothetical protein SAMN05428989_2596 [Pseudoxanthomonas sp. GM95]
MTAVLARRLSLLCLTLLLALLCVQPRMLGAQAAGAQLDGVAHIIEASASYEDTTTKEHGPPALLEEERSGWSGLPDLPDDTHDVAWSIRVTDHVRHAVRQAPAPARFDTHVDTLLRPPSA